ARASLLPVERLARRDLLPRTPRREGDLLRGVPREGRGDGRPRLLRRGPDGVLRRVPREGKKADRVRGVPHDDPGGREAGEPRRGIPPRARDRGPGGTGRGGPLRALPRALVADLLRSLPRRASPGGPRRVLAPAGTRVRRGGRPRAVLGLPPRGHLPPLPPRDPARLAPGVVGGGLLRALLLLPPAAPGERLPGAPPGDPPPRRAAPQ